MKFDLKKFEQVVTVLGPTVLQLAGVPATAIALITHGIIVAQHLPNATGAEKKAYVTELVSTGAQGVNAITGKTVVDAAQISGAVSTGIDAVINVVETVKNIPVHDVPNG